MMADKNHNIPEEKICLKDHLSKVFPVLRHPSFLKKAQIEWVFKEHSPETVILFAVEFSEGYMILSENHLQEAGMTVEELFSYSIRNLEKLDRSYHIDSVGNHKFYFFTYDDSFSASRILHSKLLPEMAKIIKGNMGVAIPHQDVLIIADLADAKGASVFSQIAFDFAMRGPVPISPLPFIVENGVLEPYIAVRNNISRHKFPIMGQGEEKKKEGPVD